MIVGYIGVKTLRRPRDGVTGREDGLTPVDSVTRHQVLISEVERLVALSRRGDCGRTGAVVEQKDGGSHERTFPGRGDDSHGAVVGDPRAVDPQFPTLALAGGPT